MTSPIAASSRSVAPAGTRYTAVNTGTGPVHLYTVSAPPEHAPGSVFRTTADADAAEQNEGSE